jgi:hypothetical protein
MAHLRSQVYHITETAIKECRDFWFGVVLFDSNFSGRSPHACAHNEIVSTITQGVDSLESKLRSLSSQVKADGTNGSGVTFPGSVVHMYWFHL